MVRAAVSTTVRILVVDDNEALLENLVECLVDEDYVVSTAAHAEEALGHLERGPLPHLLLLDMMMPGLSGAELARRIHDTPAWAAIRIVLSTGLRPHPTAMPPGVLAVLEKPFGIEALLGTVRRVLAATPPDRA
jgi:putative two-component system response regulator